MANHTSTATYSYGSQPITAASKRHSITHIPHHNHHHHSPHSSSSSSPRPRRHSASHYFQQRPEIIHDPPSSHSTSRDDVTRHQKSAPLSYPTGLQGLNWNVAASKTRLISVERQSRELRDGGVNDDERVRGEGRRDSLSRSGSGSGRRVGVPIVEQERYDGARKGGDGDASGHVERRSGEWERERQRYREWERRDVQSQRQRVGTKHVHWV